MSLYREIMDGENDQYNTDELGPFVRVAQVIRVYLR